MRNYLFAASLIFSLLLFPLGGQPASASGAIPTPLVNPDFSLSPSPKTFSPTYTGCGGIITPAINAEYEQRVVEFFDQYLLNR